MHYYVPFGVPPLPCFAVPSRPPRPPSVCSHQFHSAFPKSDEVSLQSLIPWSEGHQLVFGVPTEPFLWISLQQGYSSESSRDRSYLDNLVNL